MMGSVSTVAQAGSDLTMTVTKEGADTVVALANPAAVALMNSCRMISARGFT